MASVGKLILGFFVMGICLLGALMIYAQQASIPIGQLNIGNVSDFTNSSSAINQTSQLVVQTTNYSIGTGALFLLIIAASIIIATISLLVKRGK